MRRRLHYSLFVLALLLMVLLFAAGQRWFAVAAVQNSLRRDWEIRINGGYPELLPKAVSDGARWLFNHVSAPAKTEKEENRSAVRHDRFLSIFHGRVRQLEIYNPYTFDDHLGDAICRFDGLELLSVVEPERLYEMPQSAVTHLLRSLSRLHALKNLELGTTWMHDADVAELAGLPTIETLILNKCPITEASFPTFVTLPRLKVLEIRETHISVEQARELAGMLPNVQIDHSQRSP